MTDFGIYEYEYQGKKYRYKLYDDRLPRTVKLYFLKNPRKAVDVAELGAPNICWPLIAAIIACVIYAVLRVAPSIL